MVNAPAPRPIVGSPLHLVVLRDPTVEVLPSFLRFDRGRGMIVEADAPPPVPVRKGDRVLLAYAVDDGLYALRGSLAEVLAPTRVYVIPGGVPVMMEKREYIRAIVPIASALVIAHRAPDADRALTETSVELSASGFRWFGHVNAQAGDRCWLCLRLPGPDGACVHVRSTVVRAEPCGDSFEVAGRFDDIAPGVREAILDLVFRRRLSDLGIQAGQSWDDDA